MLPLALDPGTPTVLDVIGQLIRLDALPYICLISPLHLPYISLISPLHLPYISHLLGQLIGLDALGAQLRACLGQGYGYG